MHIFHNTFIPLPCPRCQYEFDIELQSVRLEERVICPCCKVNIKLSDSSASGYGANKEISTALDGLNQTIKKMNFTIRL